MLLRELTFLRSYITHIYGFIPQLMDEMREKSCIIGTERQHTEVWLSLDITVLNSNPHSAVY